MLYFLQLWPRALLVTALSLSPALELWPVSAPQSRPQPVTYEHNLVRSTADEGRFVALTFDDGPHPVWTPQVLDLLKQHDVQATFCLIGEHVDRYPDLVRRIVAEGHHLCDHTVHHDLGLRDRPAEAVRAEILGGLSAIHRATPDTPVPYYRAPGGGWSAYQVRMAAEAGMRSLAWSVDTRDWSRPGVPAILASVDRELRPGGVILMHDGGPDAQSDRSQSVGALRILLRDLPLRGYRFDSPA